MDDSFEWTMQLIDKISKPAKEAEGSLSILQRQLEKTDKALKNVRTRQSDSVMNDLDKQIRRNAVATQKEQEKAEKLAERNRIKAERAAEKHKRSLTFGDELAAAEAELHKIKNDPVGLKKLQATKREIRELTEGTKSFAERFEEVGAAVKRTAFVQNIMLGVEALHLAYEAGEKVVDVILDIGKEMIHAAGSAERFQISFTSLLGEDQGNEMLEYVERVSKVTEFTDDQLKGLVSHLLTVGFEAKEISQVLPASLDIAGFLGGGIEKAQAAAEALSHIQTTGEISKRSLGALGLQYEKVMQQLRKETGLSDEAIKKKIEGGKFGPQVKHAVLQSIADRQGGKLGPTAEKMGGTLDARLLKLRDLPEEIFQQWAKTPGFEKFKKAIDTILEKLSPDGPGGKRLFAALERASDKVVEIVTRFANGEGIEMFIDGVERASQGLDSARSIVDKIVTVSEVIATIWAGSKIVSVVTSLISLFPGLATAAGALAGALGTLAGALAPVALEAAAVAAAAGSIVYAIYKINEALKELGGLKYVWQDFKDWISGDGPAAATDKVNEFSPEWKKRKAMGIPSALQAPEAAPDIAGIEPAIPSQSKRAQPTAAGFTQTANLQLVINAPNGDADQIKEQVQSTLPGALQQGFERMAIASGSM